jgi:Holliday junction resolvase RusA-like endonuclease
MLEGPLRVRFDFVFPRPKGHFGSGKNATVLKRNAPQYPVVKPDATKVIRSTEDALKGILWRDDSQIVTQAATKRYGTQAGCLIRVVQESA